MGCFNLMGFYSKMPIVYGDDIVLFICASNRWFKNGMAITPTDIIEPICLPIYGKYNDYGFIEKIERDENVNALESYLETDIYELLEMFKTNPFENIFSLEKKIKEDSSNEHLKKFENVLKKITKELKIFGFSKEIKFCLSFERRDVYEKLASFDFKNLDYYGGISYRNYYELFCQHGCKTEVLSRKCRYDDDEVKDIIECAIEEKLISLKEGRFLISDSCTISEIKNEFYRKINMGNSIFKFSIYDNAKIDFAKYREKVYKFIDFNISLNKLCGRYGICNYGDQDILSRVELMKDLNELYKSILNNFKEHYYND